jgi:transcriptional regulator with XRE-family HTH domain
MNLTICDNLKELRKKKNNTQEELADFLTVSINAVSKWERGECYPDIELLPKIAAYYDVSVDDLLGVGEIRKKERIEDYQEKSKRFVRTGDNQSALAVWRKAQKEFPNDWRVLML